ncbi:hypothetical protein Q9L58_006265 [Maublancomyces gigas]|uniref:F-box domain-containing protein n=1 Tax=Discina gigas TaxID=1032678 RepID=A0ABR3GFW7_9PEZI
MHILGLGKGIILMHLIPLLDHRDLLALAAVDRGMFNELDHLRFSDTCVTHEHLDKYIVYYLRGQTLQKIRRLQVVGINGDLEIVLSSFREFSSVRSLIIIQPQSTVQQVALAQFARQLCEINEVAATNTGWMRSSVADLPAGTLNRLLILNLQGVQLPPLSRLLNDGISTPSLTSISYLPYRALDWSESGTNVTPAYVEQCIGLLKFLSQRSSLPALRFVEVVLGRGQPKNELKKERLELLHALWNCAASHGMWQLRPRKPTFQQTEVVTQEVEGWTCWCSYRTGDLFVTPQEVEAYADWCEKKGRYPRWEDFVFGNIHIDVPCTGEGVEKLYKTVVGNLALARGVSILPDNGPDLNLAAALLAVTSATRCVSIQLGTYWGGLCGNKLDCRQFTGVETLHIQHATQYNHAAGFNYPTPLNFDQNLAATVLTSLHLPLWTKLRMFSVSAIALQRGPRENHANPTTASCLKHVPAYAFPWLRNCINLRVFQVTDWAACLLCYEELEDNKCGLADAIRIDTPPGVTKVRVSGWLSYRVAGAGQNNSTWDMHEETEEEEEWREEIAESLMEALGDGVTLDYDQLNIR